jgi:hypothetical protein
VRTRDEAGNWSPVSVQSQSTLCSGNLEAVCNNGITINLGDPIDGHDGLPSALSFGPFSSSPARGPTSVSYAIPVVRRGASLDISVYDLAGRRIQTIARGTATPGWFEANWDLRTEVGDRARSGVYFVRMVVGNVRLSRTLVVLD